MAGTQISAEGWLTFDASPYVIAEIGVNHNGDLDLAKRCIDSAIACGADAVKFQMFKADEEVSDKTLVYAYERDGIRHEENMLEMLSNLEIPTDWPAILDEYAKERGVDFLSSVADADSVRRLAALSPKAIKVASCDLTYADLLLEIAATEIPVILSTGMASIDEVQEAIALLRENGCPGIVLLHCVSIYPTPDSAANLQRIRSLSEKFGCSVGYSDHTLGIEACVAATALGAPVLEKHFTIDRSLSGPDQELSSDPEELTALIGSVRRVTKQIGNGSASHNNPENESRANYRRSIVARGPIRAGSIIEQDMIAFRRPGTGLPPNQQHLVIGRSTRVDLVANEPITADKLRGS